MSYEYSGDINLDYGGIFIDLDTFMDGYCTAVRVTDLDSGCGFAGAVMIEHIVINGTTDGKCIAESLRFCGPDIDDTILTTLEALPHDPLSLGMLYDHLQDKNYTIPEIQHLLAESLASYGHYDPDDSWDSYREIVQCEPDGPMTFYGWQVDKRLHNTTLEAYVHSQHLRS